MSFLHIAALDRSLSRRSEQAPILAELAGLIVQIPALIQGGDRWKANPTASEDSQVRRAPNFDVLVRNVYKVLLTRGLIGCIIYATDPETRALLAKLGVPPA
jgi:hypothetical protein